jgi:MFS transporter, DHA2 family, lincomycin resistance protein
METKVLMDLKERRPNLRLPKYWIVILAMLFSIGPNLLIMSGFMQIQAIIQNSFSSSTYSTMVISIISNLAFAVFIPLGPVLSRKFGLRFSFYISQLISAITFFVSAISSNTIALAFSRSIEGALTGTQLMVLIPLLFIEYPAERRNQVLGILLSVLFGSVSLGAIFGSISQEYDAWRWLFLTCALSAILAIIVGKGLPRHAFPAPAQSSGPPLLENKDRFDFLGLIVLFLLGIFAAITLSAILPYGFRSPAVFIPACLTIILFINFLIVELNVSKPLLNFRLIRSVRSIIGAVIAIGSNLLMLIAMSGLGFGMRVVSQIQVNAMPSVYFGLVISVAIAAILAASFFDRIGGGPLFVLGCLCMLLASYRLTVLGENVSLDQLRIWLVIFACGVGLNFVIGLVTCGLGGPLGQLPKTITVVQFLRVFFYSAIAPISQWFLNWSTVVNQNIGAANISLTNPSFMSSYNHLVQQIGSRGEPEPIAHKIAMNLIISQVTKEAALSATHLIFLFSLIGSIGLFILAWIIVFMGKGLPISHPRQHH